MSSNPAYTGRFAPSPSGALHFGSLLAALASYLDARAAHGTWLVRMEDLDPDREPPGAADEILRTLDAFYLHWDGEVVYQSRRLPAYLHALDRLHAQDLIFACNCARHRIRILGGIYDGRCRHRNLPPDQDCALRVHAGEQESCVEDLIQGRYCQHLQTHCGDFIVRRRDGLIAYQLAVVVDDAWQNITHIVRGHDLLESTPRQVYLQTLLNYPHPAYAHIPVACNNLGQKLSKQHFARALDPAEAEQAIYAALQLLGQNPPAELANYPAEQQLEWAIQHWDIQRVPKLATIPASTQLS
jgi:glutamyl-Q tRNA(Asp) synthetase